MGGIFFQKVEPQRTQSTQRKAEEMNAIDSNWWLY